MKKDGHYTPVLIEWETGKPFAIRERDLTKTK